jgi:hypothetical protein
MDGNYMVTGMVDLFERTRKGENIITDRINLISDPIYGPICRGKCSFNAEEYQSLLNAFMLLKPVIIYCRPPRSMIRRQMAEHFQMAGVIENSDRILEAYDFLFANWYVANFEYITYSWCLTPEPDILFSYLRLKGTK